ncbi:MAG: LysR family transcriptional regulator [Bryobacteraceae bacterium]|jgi:LysR family transcriptional activator of glutamate synthase operon
MDLHQLRVFQAAVKSGGFTRASEQLHLSQSTVSQHIKMLEEELGCPLFLRVGKRVLVTEAGRVLLHYAETIFRDLRNAEMAVREMNALKRGTVRLGVGPTTLTYRLPHVLGEYSRRFPDIELIVLAGTTEFLLDALRSQHLDLAVVMRTAPQPGLSVTALGREEMIIVVNRDHPLARQKTVEPSDLASLRFILYEKHTAMQNVIDRYFESLGVTPRIAMEVENNEAIKSLVRVGLGASIMPLCAVEHEAPDGPLHVLRVKGKPLTRELRLVSADAEILPKAIRELAAALVAALGGRRGRLAAPKSIDPAD